MRRLAGGERRQARTLHRLGLIRHFADHVNSRPATAPAAGSAFMPLLSPLAEHTLTVQPRGRALTP
jgi:hypothetical protein